MELQLYLKENASIETNLDALKEMVEEKLSEYGSITEYSDAEISVAKKDRASLNALKKDIEEKRKSFKKAYLLPYDTIEAEIKEIVKSIDEPISLIDARIKEKENADKEKKRAELEEFILLQEKVLDGIKIIFDERWLNATTSMKKAKEEIMSQAERVKTDIEVLKTQEFSFEAIDYYKNNGHELSLALKEVQRLKDLEERKKAAQTPVPETPVPETPISQTQPQPSQASPEQVSPEQVSPGQTIFAENEIINLSLKPVERKWCTLSVLVSSEEAEELARFMRSRNITFK